MESGECTGEQRIGEREPEERPPRAAVPLHRSGTSRGNYFLSRTYEHNRAKSRKLRFCIPMA